MAINITGKGSREEAVRPNLRSNYVIPSTRKIIPLLLFRRVTPASLLFNLHHALFAIHIRPPWGDDHHRIQQLVVE